MPLTTAQKGIVKRWVAALRSGKYKQGRHFLRQATKKGDRFCCLGVLCELAVEAKVIPRPKVTLESGGYSYYYYGNDKHVLPKSVQKWAGLTSNLGGGGEDVDLAQMNDDGKKFSAIAKMIESMPDGLFKS